MSFHDFSISKADLEPATSIREKEHSDFVALTGDQKADLDAMTGAIAALEKGMGASFLQSQKARVSRVVKAVKASQSVDDFERDEILGLLQGKNPFGDYSARSGEITGILKVQRAVFSNLQQPGVPARLVVRLTSRRIRCERMYSM